ncbi:serine protease 23-like [Lytechinus variegatus]|uniref:serine protease 23-like n=1 Tax=Lytechinus variegatus TaxID=7654 RepID=UPI001BB220A9|nr:serine protease 23-like [Lytechinus variegatus]
MYALNLFKMLLGIFLVAMATCLASVTAERIQEWNTWQQVRLPKMHTEQDAGSDHLSKTAKALLDLKAGKRVKFGGDILDLESIERSLSFEQTSAKNLSDTIRTKISVDDAQILLNMKRYPGDSAGNMDLGEPRRKRQIFGADTRYQITKEFSKIFPFSAAVQLSTGCSGVLIGPRHVLTAAECIHNGKRYRGNSKNLRVGLIRTGNRTTSGRSPSRNPKRNANLLWYKVEQLYIPDGWVSPNLMEQPDTFNYAVLELNKDHRQNCMEVGVSSNLNTNRMQRIHYSSFDDYEYHDDPVLAYRHCFIEHVSDTNNYLYEKCDSSKSSVGAGIYLRMWDSENWQWSRRVMAVKTSETERIRVRGRMLKAARDVRLTLLNFAQICYWVMRDFEACSRGRIEDACLMA